MGLFERMTAGRPESLVTGQVARLRSPDGAGWATAKLGRDRQGKLHWEVEVEGPDPEEVVRQTLGLGGRFENTLAQWGSDADGEEE